MPDKAWKRDERKVAAFFGTVRNSLSGMNSKVTGSDTIDNQLFIENKRRKSHAVMKLMREVASDADLEIKIPVVCLTEHYQKDFGVVLKSSDLLRFCVVFLTRNGYDVQEKPLARSKR